MNEELKRFAQKTGDRLQKLVDKHNITTGRLLMEVKSPFSWDCEGNFVQQNANVVVTIRIIKSNTPKTKNSNEKEISTTGDQSPK